MPEAVRGKPEGRTSPLLVVVGIPLAALVSLGLLYWTVRRVQRSIVLLWIVVRRCVRPRVRDRPPPTAYLSDDEEAPCKED